MLTVSIFYWISDFIDLAWMYSNTSFWYMIGPTRLSLVSVHWCWFLLISMDSFFMLSRFSQTSIDSQRTLSLALNVVGMHSTAASIWAVTMFSYPSFRVCLSYVSWRVLKLFLTITVCRLLIWQLANENHAYCETLTVSFLFLRRFTRIYES